MDANNQTRSSGRKRKGLLIPTSVRYLAERLSRGVVLRRRLPACVGGGRIYVSPEGGLRFWRMRLAKCDPGLLNVAAELVEDGAVVWDVGANLGLFAFAAAGRAGPSGRVLAIEPDTWLVSLLRRSARTNGGSAAPVDVLPAAVSDRSGVSQFHIAQRARSANHLGGFGLTDTGGVRETQLVPTFTLDSLLERFPPPAVLKIDVEGAEYQVLAGGSRLLSEARPIVICEVAAENQLSVTDCFNRHAYVLFDVERPPSERKPISAAAWNTVAVPAEHRLIAGRDGN